MGLDINLNTSKIDISEEDGLNVDLYNDNIDVSDDEADDIIIEITGLKSINKFIGLEDTPLYYDNGKFFKVEDNKIVYTDIQWKDISGDLEDAPEIIDLIKELVKKINEEVIHEYINQHNNSQFAHPYIQNIIEQNYGALDTKINDTKEALTEALNTEITNRETADNELSESIQQETLARIEADTTLQNNIDTLTNNLNTEIENRTNADNLLRDDINNISGELAQEIIDRQTQDNLLQGQITSNYNSLDDKIDTEIENRTNADVTLQSNIDTLSATVSQNYTDLDGKISNLNDIVDDNNEAISTKVDNINTTLTNNINTLSNTVTDNYNTLDIKINNTKTSLESSIGDLSDTVTQNYQELNQTITNTANTINNRINTEVETLNTALTNENTQRQEADSELQSQIDAIVSSSDVFDIVGTYAELQAYDITIVPVNDIIKVLVDNTHNDSATYYRCVENEGEKSWLYIGSEGAYYTKSESDTKFVNKNTTINNKPLSSNITLTANDVGALPNTTIIGDGTLTIQVNGNDITTFTANQTGNTTANIIMPSVDQTFDGTSQNAQSGVAIAGELNNYVISEVTAQSDNGTYRIVNTGTNDGIMLGYESNEHNINNIIAVNEAIGVGLLAVNTTDTANPKMFGAIATPDGLMLVEGETQQPVTLSVSTNNNLAVNGTEIQPQLVSGTNIKTINGESVLGSGNINLSTVTNPLNVIKTVDNTTYTYSTGINANNKYFSQVEIDNGGSASTVDIPSIYTLQNGGGLNITTSTTSNSTFENIRNFNLTVDTATTNNKGIVQPDGTTINIDSNGIISADLPTVDQTFDPTSANAQSGIAIAEPLAKKQDALVAGNNITFVEGGSGEDEAVSGNGSVVLEKALVNALNSVTIAGGCEQNGTPTPDTPIDIVCNNGVIKYSINKANYIPENVVLGYWIRNNNGQFEASPTNFYTNLIPIKPNTSYVCYGRNKTDNTISGYNRIAWYDANGTWLRNSTYTQGTIGQDVSPSNGAFARFHCNINGAEVTQELINSYNWTFCEGSVEVPYIPYVEGGIYTDGTVETVEVDTTGDTATAEMLLKVGNYQDTQSILDGVVTRNVEIKVLDGTEDWGEINNGRGYWFPIGALQETYTDVIGLCSHFGFYIWDDNTVPMPVNKFGFNKSSSTGKTNGNVTFRPNLTVYSSVSAWKQYLADQYTQGTPVIVIYPKASTTTETVATQSLTIQEGTNVIEISQASISNLPISANYTQDSRPSINATVGNGTIAIYQGDTFKGSFTLNQSGDVTINLNDGGGTVDQTYDATSANAQSGVAIAGAGFLTNNADTSDSLAIGDDISSHGGRYSVLLGHSTEGHSGTVAIGYNASGVSNSTAIGNNASASGNGSTSIGSVASATANYAIQLGYGTNSVANSLSVGFYNSYTEHYNWQLLDGTTGLIPDARISSNIARTSQIPTPTYDSVNERITF